MYVLQAKPEKHVVLDTGSVVSPVATLKDEWGGVAHIFLDDHCYVLALKNDDVFRKTDHWFPAAVDAMKSLPTPIPA
jgi:hypothetical protein